MCDLGYVLSLSYVLCIDPFCSYVCFWVLRFLFQIWILVVSVPKSNNFSAFAILKVYCQNESAFVACYFED